MMKEIESPDTTDIPITALLLTEIVGTAERDGSAGVAEGGLYEAAWPVLVAGGVEHEGLAIAVWACSVVVVEWMLARRSKLLIGDIVAL